MIAALHAPCAHLSYRRWPRWLVMAAAGALSSQAAFAEMTNSVMLRTDLPDVASSAARMLGALALVLALFFGGVWVYRKGQRFSARTDGAPRLAVLESRSLGSRFAIYVVGYERQRMLIGSSPSGLTLLSALPEAPASSVPAAEPPPVSFAQQLQQLLKGKMPPANQSGIDR